MTEGWRVAGTDDVLAGGDEAVGVVIRARDSGRFETVFESDRGRTCFFVTNGVRAMIVVMNEPGDPGEHPIDSVAEGASSGYVLSNGQDDEYLNKDTLPWQAALEALRAIVDRTPSPVPWQVDR